jgi:hypothetical protein
MDFIVGFYSMWEYVASAQKPDIFPHWFHGGW